MNYSMSNVKFWRWHISIDTTKTALERFARALLETGSGLEHGTGSRLLPGYPLGRGISAHLVVSIPEGDQNEFRNIMDRSLISMGPPPQVTVGLGRPEPDGHPGRTS